MSDKDVDINDLEEYDSDEEVITTTTETASKLGGEHADMHASGFKELLL
eukprot:CAMPEP_0174233660 /NCGR_PEP_ID=MMETSP0417-20130205/3643_1 /TAXON_ID=242541 /ORGANISM="Mayorella sp, Strain BSH-02190019" /LENGTH=48 /DNA_ID= /DNA_START= /DNA_END= /DNA_ORIENTATION=